MKNEAMGESGSRALEVPLDFCGDVPDGFDVVDVPCFMYMCFNGAPYKEESWYGEAHEELYRAIEKYNPNAYGYEFAKEEAPVFHYFSSAQKGVKLNIPVKKIVSG